MLASADPSLLLRIVAVDNASADGTADFLAEQFPQVELLRCHTNDGFAGGNNAGWEFLLSHYPNLQYVALLNQDTIVKSDWLVALVTYLEGRPTVACAQSKLMLHPQTDQFNTAGNVSHFLGFGLTAACGQVDHGQFDRHRQLGLVSGASMILRVSAVARTGLFDPAFFAYLEDADLSWKLRQLGYEAAYVPQSVVFHKYNFKNDWRHYDLLERNRWFLLATYYKTATLLLLMPALLVMELGQFYFAWRTGILDQKLRACSFFLRRDNLRGLARRRVQAQRRRRIGDKRFTEPFVGAVESEELTSPLLRLANPVLAAYWTAARWFICW